MTPLLSLGAAVKVTVEPSGTFCSFFSSLPSASAAVRLPPSPALNVILCESLPNFTSTVSLPSTRSEPENDLTVRRLRSALIS